MDVGLVLQAQAVHDEGLNVCPAWQQEQSRGITCLTQLFLLQEKQVLAGCKWSKEQPLEKRFCPLKCTDEICSPENEP